MPIYLGCILKLAFLLYTGGKGREPQLPLPSGGPWGRRLHAFLSHVYPGCLPSVILCCDCAVVSPRKPSLREDSRTCISTLICCFLLSFVWLPSRVLLPPLRWYSFGVFMPLQCMPALADEMKSCLKTM